MGASLPAGLWHRLGEARRVVGPLRALMLAPRWAVRREYLVLVADLAGQGWVRPEPRDGGPLVRWTAMTDAAASLLRSVNPMLSDDDVARRRAEGQECHLAWLEDVPVHYRWESTGQAYLPYIHRHFRPLDGDMLVSEAFTRPEFRRRGLHWMSTVAALRRARERGLRRSISLVAWWNTAARRVVEQKARRRVAGTAGCWHLALSHRRFISGAVRVANDGAIYLPRNSDGDRP